MQAGVLRPAQDHRARSCRVPEQLAAETPSQGRFADTFRAIQQNRLRDTILRGSLSSVPATAAFPWKRFNPRHGQALQTLCRDVLDGPVAIDDLDPVRVDCASSR